MPKDGCLVLTAKFEIYPCNLPKPTCWKQSPFIHMLMLLGALGGEWEWVRTKGCGFIRALQGNGKN